MTEQARTTPNQRRNRPRTDPAATPTNRADKARDTPFFKEGPALVPTPPCSSTLSLEEKARVCSSDAPDVALFEAIREAGREAVPCLDPAIFGHWTADWRELREEAAAECGRCPVFAECRAASAGEVAGVWAGVDLERRRGGRR